MHFIRYYFCWDLEPMLFPPSPWLLDAFLYRLTFMNIIHMAFTDGSWPVIIWDFAEAKIWVIQASGLLEVGLAGQALHYHVTLSFCTCLLMWCSRRDLWYPFPFYQTDELLQYRSKRDVFPAQNVTFFKETLHCIWLMLHCVFCHSLCKSASAPKGIAYKCLEFVERIVPFRGKT